MYSCQAKPVPLLQCCLTFDRVRCETSPRDQATSSAREAGQHGSGGRHRQIFSRVNPSLTQRQTQLRIRYSPATDAAPCHLSLLTTLSRFRVPFHPQSPVGYCTAGLTHAFEGSAGSNSTAGSKDTHQTEHRTAYLAIGRAVEEASTGTVVGRCGGWLQHGRGSVGGCRGLLALKERVLP